MIWKPTYEGSIIDGHIMPGKPLRVYEIIKDGKNIFDGLIHPVWFPLTMGINDMLYEKYERWYAAYPDWDKMRDELDEKISGDGDYWERIYNTMLLEFNPLHNYDMTETEEDSRCEEARRASEQSQVTGGSSTVKQYGYNEQTPTDTGAEQSTGNASEHASGTEQSHHQGARTLKRAGNIGVTTSSALLREYRDIQLKFGKLYVDSFDYLFFII